MVRRRRFYTSYTLTHTRTHVQLRLYVYSYMPIASESFGNGWYSVGESRVRFVYTQVHMHIHTMYNIWAFCMRERCRTYIYMNRTRLLFTHSYAFAYEYIYTYIEVGWKTKSVEKYVNGRTVLWMQLTDTQFLNTLTLVIPNERTNGSFFSSVVFSIVFRLGVTFF